MNRKHALRFTIVFFTIMVALTFSSRTIYRHTLPMVRAEYPFGGVLKMTFTVYNPEIYTDTPIFQYFPHKISQPIRVANIHVKPGNNVQVGDPLLTFYAPDGVAVLEKIRLELENTIAAQAVWQNNMDKDKHRIMTQLTEAQTPEEMEILISELSLLQDGYYNGQSASSWQSTIQTLKALASTLSDLEERGWVYASDYAGTVWKVYAPEDALYSGVDPLFSIIPEKSPAYIRIPLDKAMEIPPGNWSPTARLETTEGSLPAEARFAEPMTLQITLSPEVSASSVSSVVIHLESGYEQMLVPNAALQNRQLYLLESAIGDWGQTVYRARKVSVKTGNSDADYTAITEGINKNDKIILKSTKELCDGQMVILDDFE